MHVSVLLRVSISFIPSSNVFAHNMIVHAVQVMHHCCTFSGHSGPTYVCVFFFFWGGGGEE